MQKSNRALALLWWTQRLVWCGRQCVSQALAAMQQAQQVSFALHLYWVRLSITLLLWRSRVWERTIDACATLQWAVSTQSWSVAYLFCVVQSVTYTSSSNLITESVNTTLNFFLIYMIFIRWNEVQLFAILILHHSSLHVKRSEFL